MRSNSVSRRIALLPVIAVLVVAGCATSPQAPGETTSVERPIARSEDPINAAIKGNASVLLATSIRIDASGPQLLRAAMVTGPSRRPPRRDGDSIVVASMAGGVTISETAVADPRFVAVEGIGITEATERNVDVLLPLPQRIDTITVTTTTDGASRKFDVTEMMKQLCADKKEVPACR